MARGPQQYLNEWIARMKVRGDIPVGKLTTLYEVSLGDFRGEYENIRKLRASRTRTLDDDGLLVHSEEWKTILPHILLQFVKERIHQISTKFHPEISKYPQEEKHLATLYPWLINKGRGDLFSTSNLVIKRRSLDFHKIQCPAPAHRSDFHTMRVAVTTPPSIPSVKPRDVPRKG
ncbi:hypothetical protein BDV30DRAFT_74202 [Aspergillus minisclerotigenes]|uniref:Uncharacterized protein n=1 Tax=Aspergillus minisclerotigenes TaxID=656917 RepID=A0A5N6JLY0_9EURO|nr:hypothetical protein BDV30DRAFT_74202 [Aspergillus minisclerotigenes]